MLKFLADENFNGAILRGLSRRVPSFDVVRVQDVGLSGADDPLVLEWAERHDRLLLTHDVSTIPEFVKHRIEAGKRVPGVVEIPAIVPIAQVLDDLALLVECSLDGEWENQIVRVPF